MSKIVRRGFAVIHGECKKLSLDTCRVGEIFEFVVTIVYSTESPQ